MRGFLLTTAASLMMMGAALADADTSAPACGQAPSWTKVSADAEAANVTVRQMTQFALGRLRPHIVKQVQFDAAYVGFEGTNDTATLFLVLNGCLQAAHSVTVEQFAKMMAPPATQDE